MEAYILRNEDNSNVFAGGELLEGVFDLVLGGLCIMGHNEKVTAKTRAQLATQQ